MSKYQIAKDYFELSLRISKIEDHLRINATAGSLRTQGECPADRISRSGSQVDEFIASILNARIGTKAESKTWPCSPDPWVAKGGEREYWRWTEVKFSIVRAYTTNNVLVCTATLSAFLTSAGVVHTNPGGVQPIRMILKDAAGGAVYPEIALAPYVEVSCTDRNRPVVYTAGINPNVFDVVECCSYYLDSESCGWC